MVLVWPIWARLVVSSSPYPLLFYGFPYHKARWDFPDEKIHFPSDKCGSNPVPVILTSSETLGKLLTWLKSQFPHRCIRLSQSTCFTGLCWRWESKEMVRNFVSFYYWKESWKPPVCSSYYWEEGTGCCCNVFFFFKTTFLIILFEFFSHKHLMSFFFLLSLFNVFWMISGEIIGFSIILFLRLLWFKKN